MAFSVERTMAKAAAALLPALLPPPPSMITPSPCIIILPVASNPKFPKPGRADAAERWDAHKNGSKTKPGSPASSSCGISSPGRADSAERWDIRKKKTDCISSTSSSCEKKWEGEDSNKRPPSRASSAGRWDAHKKHRPAAQADDADQEEPKVFDEQPPQEDEATMAPRTQLVFSGPSFVASPEPRMLPTPAFFPRRAGMITLPAFVQAR